MLKKKSYQWQRLSCNPDSFRQLLNIYTIVSYRFLYLINCADQTMKGPDKARYDASVSLYYVNDICS